jgi:putative ABC transport system permease protein
MSWPTTSWPTTSWPATSWLGAIRTATGGLLRHKVQTVVLGMVLLVSTASATLGFALLAASNAPFQHAFAAQRGADVAVTVNAARASSAELASTGRLAGVTAAAGPFAAATVQVQFGGQPFGPLMLAGRASPGGPVDDVVLTAGHWPDGPGQLVLDASPGPGGGGQGGGGPQLGGTLPVTGVPGAPALTIVGFANSVTNTADGWVTPGEIASLRAPGTPASAQLLYRFTTAGSYAQVRADAAEVTRALPPGTVAGASSWLAAQDASTGNGAIMEPFVVAFALIGLVMAVLIVGNVVSGAVVAGYHRIGVLKSIGLTPAQVVVAYLSRVGWPALAGCLAGVVAGNLLAVSVLRQSSAAYGVGSQQVPWWASVAAPAGMLALTALAAFGPALRAGRLSAAEAIAAGRAPRAGRGYLAHRLASRLGLPRPVSLGLAAPFARPARTLVSLAAIAFGATAVIFAFGLHSSLSRAAASQTLSATVPVQLQVFGLGAGPQQWPDAAQDAAVTAALRAQPGTRHEVAVYQGQVKTPGIAQSVGAQAFGGGASWIGYGIITGHWYDAPGQVDVNTAFLTQSGLAVGDSATVTIGTNPVTVRIAGEVFQPSGQPMVFGSTQTLPGLATTVNLQEYYVGLRPGTSAAAYIQAVNARLGSRSPWAATGPQGGQFYQIASALIGLLALMVAIAAGLGVLNTVLLMTSRDRWCTTSAIPVSFTQVFPPSRLALLSLAALAIAAAGALLPAGWAARARPATALRAE